MKIETIALLIFLGAVLVTTLISLTTTYTYTYI